MVKWAMSVDCFMKCSLILGTTMMSKVSPDTTNESCIFFVWPLDIVHVIDKVRHNHNYHHHLFPALSPSSFIIMATRSVYRYGSL